jgi:hypothetical protein
MRKLATLQPKMRSRRLRKRRVPMSDVLIISVETLWSNKLRTGLTMLGQGYFILIEELIG